VIGSDDCSLYVFHPDSGWSAATCAPVGASPAVGDINSDGSLEVVVAADSMLYVWERDGGLLDNWPIAICGRRCQSYTSALADVNGDDTLDIFVPVDSMVYVLKYDTTGMSGWPVVVNSCVRTMSAPAVADVNGDEDPEIFVSAHRSLFWDSLYVYAWDATGTALSGWPPAPDSMIPPTITGEGFPSPALANLDDSGDWEITVGLADTMYAWDDSGSDLTGWPAVPDRPVTSSPAVGNFYPAEAGYEIIAGAQDLVYAWEMDGDVIEYGVWWPQPTEGIVRSSPALANIASPDTLLEVVVGSNGGYVYALDLHGYDLTNFPFPTRAAVTSSPAIADVDGDGQLELVVGCQDGYVFLWFLEGADCDTLATPWPTFKHDRQRTAWYEYTP
jgi:hypothetical protein